MLARIAVMFWYPPGIRVDGKISESSTEGSLAVEVSGAGAGDGEGAAAGVDAADDCWS